MTELGDRSTEGRMSRNLGNAYYGLGDLKNSIHFYELCIKVNTEVGDRYGEGSVCLDLGNTYCELGAFKKGIDCYALCLKFFYKSGRPGIRMRSI